MSAPEVTAAVLRVAEALGTATRGDQAETNARVALAVALDVDEMARVLWGHTGPDYMVTGGGDLAECPTCGDVPVSLAEHQAAALRAALLGSES